MIKNNDRYTLGKITDLILLKLSFWKIINVMNTNIAKISDSKKIATFGSDKNLQSKITQINDNDSLAFWIQNYFDKMILRGKSKTKKAKKMDL